LAHRQVHGAAGSPKNIQLVNFGRFHARYRPCQGFPLDTFER
jgi:hypothetical protein